ncbi:MAG: nicotinate-nucleotide adenylyltransferase [Paramuribaculum sp.]|nr:nicotinate-nucleotide adenylyltransferase [Paramuribaculum sp.]
MVPLAQIGVFGGSFNPVHCGHMMLASWLAQFTSLSEVWMMLSPENPLKHPNTTNSVHRMAMLEMAVDHAPRLKACDIELHLPRPSYTINTLRELKRRWPQYQFRLIIGSDNWLIFDQWRNHDEIISDFSPIIYPRPGYDISHLTLPRGVEMVNAPTIELSSTMIRQAITEGKKMNHFLPHGVYQYIITHNLYK